jgi:hypothetical protein
VALSVVSGQRRRRFALVAVVVAVLLALPALMSLHRVHAAGITAAQLRTAVLASTQRPYQGYAESTVELGVPDLPNLGSVTSLFNGTTRIRTWYAATDRWRVDVLGLVGEHGVYATPAGEFTWDYGRDLLAQQIGQPGVRLPRAGDLVPPDLARRLLSEATDDQLQTLPAREVAGVDAAGLRLQPADKDTTVQRVDVWADPATGLPLQVELTATGAATPVLVTRFVELSYDRPTDQVLTPQRGQDSGFTLTTTPDITDALGVLGRGAMPATLAGHPLRRSGFGGVQGVGLYGSGLSTFVALPVPRDVGFSANDSATKAGAAEIDLTAGTARLLSVPPLNVVVAHANSRRWYLVAGLVRPEVLEQAAGELSTLPRDTR